MGENREWCLLAIICKTWPQHIWITHMHWNKARFSSLTWPSFHGMEWISACFRCFRLISLAMIHRKGNNQCHYHTKRNVSKWTKLLYWLKLDWTQDLFHILIISILCHNFSAWDILVYSHTVFRDKWCFCKGHFSLPLPTLLIHHVTSCFYLFSTHIR